MRAATARNVAQNRPPDCPRATESDYGLHPDAAPVLVAPSVPYLPIS